MSLQFGVFIFQGVQLVAKHIGSVSSEASVMAMTVVAHTAMALIMMAVWLVTTVMDMIVMAVTVMAVAVIAVSLATVLVCGDHPTGSPPLNCL